MSQAVNALFAFVIGILAVYLFELRMSDTFDYRCSHCGEEFTLPAWRALLAPHILMSKVVRCPHCGRITMAAPVRKDQP